MGTAVSERVRPQTEAGTSPLITWHLLSAWHLLSLDAPTVAALWTAFLARVFQVSLPWQAVGALFLAVWMLYAADRISDAAQGHALEERHRFHHRYRTAFAGAALVALGLLAALLIWVPHALRTGWLMMTLPMAMYAAAVHLLRWQRVPKEVLVACFFAAACGMPLFTSGNVAPLRSVLACVTFGLLCWLNCIAIARWEHTPSYQLDPLSASLCERFQRTCRVLVGAMSALALAAEACHASALSKTSCAAAMASIALILLHRNREQWSATALRSLADAALLTPLLLWPWLPGVAAR